MEDVVVGNVVKGVVTGIESYGIFVKINDEYCGLIHISEITEKFVKDINNYVSIGEKIFVEIKEINNKKCILSIKDLNYKLNPNRKVKESVRGFSPLKQHLPLWIDEKINQINNNK